MRWLSRINLRDKENLSTIKGNKGKFIAVYFRIGTGGQRFLPIKVSELSAIEGKMNVRDSSLLR
jgi:hypothetical protein